MDATRRIFLEDVAITKFTLLIGPCPELISELTRDGLIEWQWNDGIPVYEITAAGSAALKAAALVADQRQERKD